MPGRRNPHDIEFTGPVALAQNESEERREISRIVEEGLKADQDRSGWLDRQKELSKLRYGLRPRTKNWPFLGASNIAIPLIDSTIRKYKPLKMRLIVEPDPVVEFQGDDPEAVNAEREAEEFYNWLFKTDMDAIEPLAYVIDYESHRGFAFAQVFWDYQTEYECRMVDVRGIFGPVLPGQTQDQNGQVTGQPDANAITQALIQQYDFHTDDPRTRRKLAETVDRITRGQPFVKIAFRRVIRDRPGVVDRDPVQVIMPPRATNPKSAEWLVIQHVLSMRHLERMEADGYFEKGAVRKIRRDMARSDDIRQGRAPADTEVELTRGMQTWREIEDRRTQIWGAEDEENVLVWEVFHWTDIDGDGLLDRTHTWIHPRSRSKLVSRPYLFPFHRWPIVKFDFEKTSRRWHSPRGISAMLEGMQRETNAQHNARIDAMTLRNAPTYQTQVAAGFKAKNFRVIPGTVLQMPTGSRLEPLIQDRSAFPEQVSEEQQLRSMAENYIGTFDAVLTNNFQVQKARTATEVQAATQFAASTANFDTMLFQLSMRELHEMIWQLWLDLGRDETFIKVIGPDGQPAGKLVRKSEIAKSFKLIPTGTVANTNRALELAHAREALQIYVNDQSGFINPFELRRWHINLLAFRQARRILNTPDQARELQTLRQAAAAIEENPELQSAIAGQAFSIPDEEIQRQQTEQQPRQPANRF